ncbi:hypothetical protein G7A72_12235 [Flavobacterium sp. Sr18]|uniref:hypothetical protein n=1 Tax=Flavobacterium sp. Sr18 TaxID=935222 RepID=UPI0013E4163C|nr:hypothetical protein [Flavobacterium sp. Sr18]QIH39536.1 hypothetical protein G7A72_12235 [Flavobacterium sp. Sr18]
MNTISQIRKLIQSVSVITPLGKKEIVFDENQKHKMSIDIGNLNLSNFNAFDIEIVFTIPISKFRNHDYTWITCPVDCVANQYSPKIIQLSNGFFVQANITNGIWEVNKNNARVLLWRFNPEMSSPMALYLGSKYEKVIVQTEQNFNFKEHPALLFISNEAIEISRSKIPFSAIAVFTDHCDFDTALNIALQRTFFKENAIKISKGFFLNHFSKRPDNASFQNDAEELTKWKEDGHELCYHSLSQSIKSEKDSFDDFYCFVPPFTDVETWIDHGYQPYNLSLFQNRKVANKVYEDALQQKNIRTLWNYIDSGTATSGVINQLNVQHFTLSRFLIGNKDLYLIKRMQLMIKNIIFHYYNDDALLLQYKSTATHFKKLFFQKKAGSLLPLLKNAFKLSAAILYVFIFWKRSKIKPYKLAKYQPILFKHRIFEKEFYIFQTLEMVDFKKALSKKNIDDLIEEKGMFIAHTYFSVPMSYHKGRMFATPNTIDTVVAGNFNYLGAKIVNNEIWNPTLSELVEYWSNFDTVVLDIDLNGVVFVKNKTDLNYRKVK